MTRTFSLTVRDLQCITDERGINITEATYRVELDEAAQQAAKDIGLELKQGEKVSNKPLSESVFTNCPNCSHDLVQTILILEEGVKKLGDAEHPQDCSACELEKEESSTATP